MRIYTKTGDAGETGLFDGTRVSKADPRVEAYGDVDELNAWLGLVRARGRRPRHRRRCSSQIQRDLFALGAVLADPRHQIAARVEKATLGDDDVDAARAGRSTRSRPSCRRCAGSSWPADRRPARCCTSPARSAAAPSGASSRSAPTPSIRSSLIYITGCPICCSSWRARSTHARASPKSSGSRRRLRPVPASSRGSTTRISGGVAAAAARGAAAHRRDLRVRPHRRRLRRRGRAHAGARLALLDDWRDRLHEAAAGDASPTRTPTPARSSCALADTMRRCELERQLFDDLLSAFRQDVVVTDTRPGTTCSTTAGGRRIRSAGWCCGSPAIATHGWTRCPTRSARRCSSRTSGRIFERDWQKGRLYVPLARVRCGRRADERDLAARRITPEWRAALRARPPRRARCSLHGRPVADAVAAACAGSCARPGSAACASSIGSRRGLRRVHVAARRSAGPTRLSIGWRALVVALTIRDAMRKTSFYYSFLVLPRAAAARDHRRLRLLPRGRRRRRSGDRSGARQAALDAVARARSRASSTAAHPTTPQGRALQPFVAPFHLPREQFDALVDGVAMDATPRRYQTFADLEPYCHRVASAVGLMCAEIFGYREPRVLDYARDLGVALQLTNILRDVARRLPARPLVPAARGSRAVRLHRGRHPAARSSRPASGVQSAEGAGGARASGGARARLLRSRRPRAAEGRRVGGSSPPRSCARSTWSCCGASRRPSATCSAASFGCRGRRRRVSRIKTWLRDCA